MNEHERRTIDSAGTTRSAWEEREERRINEEARARCKAFETKPTTIIVTWAQLEEMKRKAAGGGK